MNIREAVMKVRKMIDFHCHFLPNIDDGSQSIDESIKILKQLSEQTVDMVVATPHFIANNESVESFIQRRQKAYKELAENLHDGLPEIKLGAEVEFYEGISNLKGLDKLCIEGTNILLIEMPNIKWTKLVVNELYRLVSFGNIRIMLAHVERCLFMQDPDVVDYLLRNGVIMQSNASYFIRTLTKRKACKYLSNDVVHVLGSDSHNMTSRPPRIKEALQVIEKKLGTESIEYLNDVSKNIILETYG